MLTDKDFMINEFAVKKMSEAKKYKLNNICVYTIHTLNFKPIKKIGKQSMNCL